MNLIPKSMTCCDEFCPTNVTEAVSKSKKSQWKLPNVIRTQIFKHLTDSKALVRKINEDMAPKTFQEKYVAGRSFYKKNFRVWWLKNKYIPISCRTLIHFVTFVETFFATKYQFPMLIILFSLRLDVIEFTDIIDCMRYLQGQLKVRQFCDLLLTCIQIDR